MYSMWSNVAVDQKDKPNGEKTCFGNSFPDAKPFSLVPFLDLKPLVSRLKSHQQSLYISLFCLFCPTMFLGGVAFL